MTEKIWYEDFVQFIHPENIFNIIPLQSMSLEQKLNAIIRFFLYLGIILALVKMDARYLFMGIIAALVSFLVYEFEKKEKGIAEKFLKKASVDIVDNKLCTRTNIENPFMNPTIVDITERPTRPEACPVYKEGIREQVNDNFNKRVFKDVSDIWGKDYSAREFYTVPSTTIPNKQDEFAEWLYGHGPTCKEGNGMECDVRNYRYILR